MTLTRVRMILAFLSLAIVVLSCTTTKTECYPGDYRSCACDDTNGGFQQCPVGGAGFGACDCSGSFPWQQGADAATPLEAGDAGEGVDADSGLLPFLAPCMVDAQCASGYCGSFPTKGSRCTIHCKSLADCPAPSPKCNPMGQCSVP